MNRFREEFPAFCMGIGVGGLIITLVVRIATL